MAFTYDPIFAADPSNAANVAANASITIWDPADPGKNPVTITDLTGSPLPNPITVNKNGFGPAFMHATLDRLGWSGGGFSNFFTSYEGLKQVAVDAQAAAEAAGATAAAEASTALAPVIADAEAATAAANTAATNATAPTDTAVAAAINGTGTQTKAALNATYDPVTSYSPVAAGALGNGVQDDSAVLQALIDDAAAQFAAGLAFTKRQVDVQLPRGAWGLGTNLLAKTGVRLRGVGKASKMVALAGLGSAPLISGTSGNTVTDFTVEDVAFDGSFSTTAAAALGVRVTNGARITVSRCHFTNFGNAGVVYQGLNAGGGTPDSKVTDCTFDGIGLSDGTTGYGILFKDASARCIAQGNVMKNVKGGMGVGGDGSAGTGYPLRCIVTDNIITMAAGTTGFEPIGFVAGCDYWSVSGNQLYDSYDNGISCSGSYALVTGNLIDGAWNHGIAAVGQHHLITGNTIRNVGKENPAAAYAFISLTSTSRSYVALNKGFDDQGSPTTTHGVKLSTSGGNNILFGNTWTGNSGANVTGNIASDMAVQFLADGIQTRRVGVDIIQEQTVGAGIAIGSTCGLNGLSYVGSGRLGAGQQVASSNLPASRPATYAYAPFNQAADIAQWATTASDNVTQTVRAGITSTGRFYSTEGVRTKDLGAIDGKTSAQIDALFLSTPSDGTMAVGTLSAAPVFLHRRGGKWNYSAATQIA